MLITLLGTPVIYHLRYGETVCGVLTKLFAYEITLRLEDGRTAILMKHAVDWIEPGA